MAQVRAGRIRGNPRGEQLAHRIEVARAGGIHQGLGTRLHQARARGLLPGDFAHVGPREGQARGGEDGLRVRRGTEAEDDELEAGLQSGDLRAVHLQWEAGGLDEARLGGEGSPLHPRLGAGAGVTGLPRMMA